MRFKSNENFNKTMLTWINKENPQTYLDDLRIECLQAMSHIDLISDHKWHFYRKLLNNFDFESRHFAVNRACYKLWEILAFFKNFNNTNPQNVLCLAEAPGSFIQVIKKKYPNTQLIAVSKPPSSYAEVVKKGKSIPVFHPKILSLSNSQFFYIDILNFQQLTSPHLRLKAGYRTFDESIDSSFFKQFSNYFDLITADGGFDEEKQYNAKESLHYNLIQSEIICILMTQKLNGSVILKIFETFTETTISLLWLLCKHYKYFELFKPLTSRPTNAEKYIICTGFTGTTYSQNELLNLLHFKIDIGMTLNIIFPDTFLEKILYFSKFITKCQINMINKVVSYISETHIDKKFYDSLKNKTFQQWKKQFSFDES